MVSVDTETNVTDSIADRFLLGIAVSTDDQDFYLPIDHRGTLFSENYTGKIPKELFLSAKKIVMHNAKFDIQILRKKGFLIPDEVEDTLLMSHYIDENPPHGLKELAASLLGYTEPKEKQLLVKKLSMLGGGYEQIPTYVMADYAMQDSRMTYELYRKLEGEFTPYRPLWEETDRDFLRLLLQMENRGLVLDSLLASELSYALDIRMRAILQELGFDPMKKKPLADKLLLDPPLGLGIPLHAFSISPKTGAPSFDEAALEKIGHPVTATILEYRRAVKQKGYYSSYLDLSQYDGRIHPTFKQHGTTTGRLSCENPNLQQVPHDSIIKTLFLPEEDHQLWEFDFKNLEMRLAACYSRNKNLLETFQNEGDVHQEVADRLRISRRNAKTVNFAILYGAGPVKLAEQLGIRRADADQILQDYWSTYPEIKFQIDLATETADIQRWVKMWTGRRRHFKYSSEHHKAFNAVIQGGSFEIVKRSMLRLDEAGFDIRNCVHDSVWINLKDEKDVPEIQNILSDWTRTEFEIPFTTDAKRLN